VPPVASHHTATVDEPWDGPANEARMSNDAGASTFRRMYAWSDPDGDADTKAGWKFPHHQVSADGSPGPANLAACRNIKARVPQADIPASDDAGVNAHAQTHLDDAGSSATATAIDFSAGGTVTGTGPQLVTLHAGEVVLPLELDAEQIGEIIEQRLFEPEATLPLRSYRHVSRAFYNRAWAIDGEMLREMSRILQGRLGGVRLSEDAIARRLAEAEGENGPRQGATKVGSVAVIPMYGPITDRISLMSDISGGTSTAEMSQLLRKVLADDTISAVVFDIDSPGGVTDGAPEFAAELRRARAGTKPIVGQVNTLAASAAYWYASQMSEIVVTPSGEVGSIGVYAAHTDMSAANEAAGMKVTYISAAPFKVEGNPDEPLTDEGRAAIQGQIDEFYEMFLGDVAKGRGVSADVVREGYGQGRTLLARKALAAGMVDRVDTMEATLRRLQRKPAAAARRLSEDFPLPALAVLAEAETYVEQPALAAASVHLQPDAAWNKRMKGLLRKPRAR
jgi:signal peptide peptidase SppA